MCRNIRPLNNFEPPATRDEVTAAALQYVRKVAGTTKPSQANEEVFYAAVKEIAHITEHLLDDLVTAAASLESVQSKDLGTSVEIRVRHADGHWIPVEARGWSGVHDHRIRGTVVVLRLIHDRGAWRVTAGDARARLALSYAAQAGFDIPLARASLEAAVAAEPDNALAWARLGEAQLMQGDVRAAARPSSPQVSSVRCERSAVPASSNGMIPFPPVACIRRSATAIGTSPPSTSP